MFQSCLTEEKQFVCSCQNKILNKHQINDHLKLRSTHKITSIDATQFSKDFNSSILDKISNIVKAQIQIQASTNQLIQSITKNTSIIIEKLSNLINFYRLLILNPPKLNNIKNLEVFSTFKINQSLYASITQHFKQEPVAQINKIDLIQRNLKTQVFDIKGSHVGAILCMGVFSDEKRVVTGGADGAIRVWNLQTKSQIWTIFKHKDHINCLALGNLENLLLTGSNDTTVRLWDLNMKSQIHKFEGHTDFVTCVLFSKDQSIGFSASSDNTIKIWNLKSLAPQKTIKFKTILEQICLIKEEKIIVACSDNGSVSFFYFKKNTHSSTPSHHNFLLRSICFTPNEEHFITGSVDGTVEVWITNGFKRSFFQKIHSAQINTIKISTCSNFFATGSNDNRVIIWDFNKFQTIRSLKNQSRVSSLYFVNHSSSLIITWAFGINCCNLYTFAIEERIKTRPLISITVSFDLKYLAYGIFRVNLIEVQNKTKVKKSFKITTKIKCLKFSPNSALVAARCGGGEIIIFSIPELKQIYNLTTNLPSINCLSFSKSNKLIGYSDFNTSVEVISIAAEEIVYIKKGKVISACFCSNDENFIYSIDVNVYVLGKDFKFLAKITFTSNVRELFVNEDNSHVLVSHFKSKWSLIQDRSFKKIFENRGRAFVKKWCASNQDLLFGTYLSLQIN